MIGVNVGLGRVEARQCLALQADASIIVSIGELIVAVRASLEGCPATLR